MPTSPGVQAPSEPLLVAVYASSRVPRVEAIRNGTNTLVRLLLVSCCRADNHAACAFHSGFARRTVFSRRELFLPDVTLRTCFLVD